MNRERIKINWKFDPQSRPAQVWLQKDIFHF
jgi:hypothetical protein